MKSLEVTLFILLTTFFIFCHFPEQPQDDCQVLLPAISGTYEGDCKKGKAHGQGKAVGEDTYEGEFKKGLPDGKGVYTWNNGDYYDGMWKEGAKEGEGKMVYIQTDQPDSVLAGFWKADDYIGEYEEPYKIESKSANINKIQVVRRGSTPNQLQINVTRMNRKVGVSNLRIESNSGNYFSDKFNVSQYPFEAEMSFETAAATGFGAANERFNFKIQIMESGSWEVIVNLVNV